MVGGILPSQKSGIVIESVLEFTTKQGDKLSLLTKQMFLSQDLESLTYHWPSRWVRRGLSTESGEVEKDCNFLSKPHRDRVRGLAQVQLLLSTAS